MKKDDLYVIFGILMTLVVLTIGWRYALAVTPPVINDVNVSPELYLPGVHAREHGELLLVRALEATRVDVCDWIPVDFLHTAPEKREKEEERESVVQKV